MFSHFHMLVGVLTKYEIISFMIINLQRVRICRRKCNGVQAVTICVVAFCLPEHLYA